MGEFVNKLEKPWFIYFITILLGIFFGVVAAFSLKIAFLILLGIPIAIFAFIRPEMGLLIYIGTLPFNNYIPRTPGLEFVSVAVFLKLLIFFSLIIKLAKKEIRFVNNSLNLAIIGFTISVLVSTLVASNLNYAFNFIYDFFHVLILYFLMIHLIRTEKLLKWTILILVLSGFVAALFGISQYLFGFGLVNGRITGTLGNPNFFISFLNFLIPLSFTLFFIEKKIIQKIFFIIILFILFIANFLTASRGGLVSLIIILLLLLLKQKYKISILSILLILLLIFSVLIPLTFWQRAGTLIGVSSGIDNEGLDTGISRIKFWSISLEMFFDNFWIGVGPGNFLNNMVYYLPYTSKYLANFSTHSTYFQVAAEFGFFGLLFFLTTLFLAYMTIKKTHSTKNKNNFIILELSEINLTGFLILFLSMDLLNFTFLWILFAFIVSSGSINGENKDIVLN